MRSNGQGVTNHGMSKLPGRMGRVLMVINGERVGGRVWYPPFVASQAEAVRGLGWKCMVHVCEFKGNPCRMVKEIRGVKSAVRSFAPDLIHAQYGSLNALTSLLAKNRMPLSVSFCGDDLLGTPLKGLKWRIRERISIISSLVAAVFADRIIVKSSNLFDHLPRFLHHKAKIIPNGVDVNVFKPLDQNRCRSELGINEDEFPIICFNESSGENAYVKNGALARSAFMHVKKYYGNARFLSFTGLGQEHVAKIFSAADCLVVTSLHEGSPNIVKEAMACDCPVVSVPCGDVVDRLDRVDYSSVVGYDPKELANAVVAIVAQKKRSNGRRVLCEAGLDASSTALSLVDSYIEMLEC